MTFISILDLFLDIIFNALKWIHTGLCPFLYVETSVAKLSGSTFLGALITPTPSSLRLEAFCRVLHLLGF